MAQRFNQATTYLWRSIITLCLISSTLLYGCTPAPEVVATIDGEKITIEQLRTRINIYNNNNNPITAENPATPGITTINEPESKLATAEATLSQLINEQLLLIEARRQGILPKNRSTPAQQEAARRRVLNGFGKNVAYPSYQEAYDYYKKHRNEFLTEPRYQIELLLLNSEDQAWKLKAKLEKGQLSMAEAARKDTGIQLADDLYERLITGAEMPIEVATVLPKLKLHKISQPIATPYGYHLIRINKKLPAGIIQFAEVENRIKDQLFAARLQKNYHHWLQQSRKQHTIKVYHQHLTAFFT